MLSGFLTSIFFGIVSHDPFILFPSIASCCLPASCFSSLCFPSICFSSLSFLIIPYGFCFILSTITLSFSRRSCCLALLFPVVSSSCLLLVPLVSFLVLFPIHFTLFLIVLSPSSHHLVVANSFYRDVLSVVRGIFGLCCCWVGKLGYSAWQKVLASGWDDSHCPFRLSKLAEGRTSWHVTQCRGNEKAGSCFDQVQGQAGCSGGTRGQLKWYWVPSAETFAAESEQSGSHEPERISSGALCWGPGCPLRWSWEPCWGPALPTDMKSWRESWQLRSGAAQCDEELVRVGEEKKKKEEREEEKMIFFRS